MEQMHIDYNRAAFAVEIKAIQERFEEILKYAANDEIKLSELNRNMKAASWLGKTYANNIELIIWH
jgi:hypothetical protein